MGSTSYGFDVRVPVGSRIFLLQDVQTGSGAHPASYPMGTGALSPRIKRQEREADHSLPINAEVKKMWIYTSTPLYAFMVWCFNSLCKGQIYFIGRWQDFLDGESARRQAANYTGQHTQEKCR
jgi:hypothetical protein